MFNFLGLGHNVDIRIVISDMESRRYEEFKDEGGQSYKVPIYYDGESISGQVLLGLKRGSKLEHQGIRIEFIGVIEFYADRSNRDEFVSLSQDLARPGILSQPTSYPFEFSDVCKPHESYCGMHVRLRYLLRVTVQRRLTDLSKEREILVHSLSRPAIPGEGFSLEVGIEDSLHIEFQYDKFKYHLEDVIVGKIYFMLVRVKIKNMELKIIKRETLGHGPNVFNDSDTVAQYEIMDGAPVRGESIPIRLFLQPYPLTPTMRDVNRKFSVRYFINLVLLDEEDRRYYKQQEIILYRRSEKRRKLQPAHTPVEDNRPSNGDVSSSSVDLHGTTGDHPEDLPSPEMNDHLKDVPESQSPVVIVPSSSEGKDVRSERETFSTDASECLVKQKLPDTDNSPEFNRASRSMSRYEPKPANTQLNDSINALTLSPEPPASCEHSPTVTQASLLPDCLNEYQGKIVDVFDDT